MQQIKGILLVRRARRPSEIQHNGLFRHNQPSNGPVNSSQEIASQLLQLGLIICRRHETHLVELLPLQRRDA